MQGTTNETESSAIPTGDQSAVIAVTNHPHNTDPSAAIVSGARERLSIFKVNAGFIPVLDGRTYPRTFATEAAAREAARGLGA